MLGAEHPQTLLHATNLASTYSNQGRIAEAEGLLVGVLPVFRRVCGAAHPETLRAARNLAHTYREQGRDADAGELRTLYRL